MQSSNYLPFRWFCAPVSWVQCHSLIYPPVQGLKVDLKDKNAVKKIDEFWKVPRATAEKGYRLSAGDQGFYFLYAPNVVLGPEDSRGLVREAIRQLTSFRIAWISQFTVTIDGMVAAPLQFFADRSFAGAGNAFNQIICDAHFLAF